jgi:hypothetical protein
MSLHPEPLGPVPEETARVARAAFRRGNPYLKLRDVLGSVYADADFADLFPRRGQAAEAPWRLALVTAPFLAEALAGLAQAVIGLLRGSMDTTTSWEEEPGQYRWRFHREGETVQVRVLWFKTAWTRSGRTRRA